LCSLFPRAQPRSKSWGVPKQIVFVRGRAKSGRWRRFKQVPPNFVFLLSYHYSHCCNQQKCTGFSSDTNLLDNVRGTYWKSTTILHRKAGSTWWFLHVRFSYMIVPSPWVTDPQKKTVSKVGGHSRVWRFRTADLLVVVPLAFSVVQLSGVAPQFLPKLDVVQPPTPMPQPKGCFIRKHGDAWQQLSYV
jgi:hypothetical protein